MVKCDPRQARKLPNDQRSAGLSVCLATPLLLLRPGPGLTISLTSCTPRGPLSTGMLARAWRRGSSLKLGRTWLPWRRTMRRLALTLETPEMMMEKEKNINSAQFEHPSFDLIGYILDWFQIKH